MKRFSQFAGAAALALFAAAAVAAPGAMDGVEEHIYMVSNERRIRHPAIEVLLGAAPPAAQAPKV